MSYSKEIAEDKLIKAVGTILLSIVFAIAAYIILTKYADTVVFKDAINASKEAIDVTTNWFNEKLNISFSFLENEKVYFALQVYCFSSMPFGYYLAGKLLGYGLSLVRFIFKLIIAAFVSPIIMPIALIVSIVSIVKNIKILAKN